MIEIDARGVERLRHTETKIRLKDLTITQKRMGMRQAFAVRKSCALRVKYAFAEHCKYEIPCTRLFGATDAHQKQKSATPLIVAYARRSDRQTKEIAPDPLCDSHIAKIQAPRNPINMANPDACIRINNIPD